MNHHPVKHRPYCSRIPKVVRKPLPCDLCQPLSAEFPFCVDVHHPSFNRQTIQAAYDAHAQAELGLAKACGPNHLCDAPSWEAPEQGGVERGQGGAQVAGLLVQLLKKGVRLQQAIYDTLNDDFYCYPL